MKYLLLSIFWLLVVVDVFAFLFFVALLGNEGAVADWEYAAGIISFLAVAVLTGLASWLHDIIKRRYSGEILDQRG